MYTKFNFIYFVKHSYGYDSYAGIVTLKNKLKNYSFKCKRTCRKIIPPIIQGCRRVRGETRLMDQ